MLSEGLGIFSAPDNLIPLRASRYYGEDREENSEYARPWATQVFHAAQTPAVRIPT